MKKLALVSIIAMALGGCSATGNGLMSDLTNSIKPESTANKFSQSLNAGQLNDAVKIAEQEASFDDETSTLDDQLWGMQTATLYRYQGDYVNSNIYFDLIEDVMYQEDTESTLTNAGETVMSSLTNDAFSDYEQSVYDSIMVNTYKAINFTAMGDVVNARVEWNRSDDRQRRAADFFAERINEMKGKQQEDATKEGEEEATENVSKSMQEVGGLLAEQNIDMSEWSAYDGYINPFSTYMHGLFFMLHAQDASDLNKAIESFIRVNDITKTKVAADTLLLAQQIRNGSKLLTQTNKVWVVFENGEMATKEEFRIDLPVFLASDNVNYAGIALPKVVDRPDHFSHVEVNGISSEVIADMDKIIKAEFKEEWPIILTREVTRSVIKTVAQKQVNDKNVWLGMAAGLLQAATTQADTRTWSALPKNFQAMMLDSDGSGKLTINSPGFSTPLQIDVVAGKNNIVYIKAMNRGLPPSVEVISI